MIDTIVITISRPWAVGSFAFLLWCGTLWFGYCVGYQRGYLKGFVIRACNPPQPPGPVNPGKPLGPFGSFKDDP